MLIQRHGYALARTTDAYTWINFAFFYALSQSMGEVGIIATFLAVCPIVFERDAFFCKILLDKLFERKASMVAGKAYNFYIHVL